MPVIDHAVHASTSVGEDHRYGCFNKEPSRSHYLVKDIQWFGIGDRCAPLVRPVPHVMSTDCRHDGSLADRFCEGCKHRGQGEEYAAMVREQGA